VKKSQVGFLLAVAVFFVNAFVGVDMSGEAAM
jgi:hypothetical protein